MDEEKPQSWWKTLPGIMTAVTAFLTAITGLIVALHQTGMFSGVQEPSPKTTPTLAAPGLISPENRALLPQPYQAVEKLFCL